MADRFGRRTIIVVASMAFPALVATFYAGPARFVAIPWTAMVFTNMAIGVMLRALATELFPTAFRGAAGGTLALLELATIIAAEAVFLVPETAQRELEQISDEGPCRTSRWSRAPRVEAVGGSVGGAGWPGAHPRYTEGDPGTNCRLRSRRLRSATPWLDASTDLA
jgi:hypothetical protein